ncbi:hypothetical protein AYI68_g4371 [Smittium mucronatum]|uniref:snRNA-activating protein complex subunit 1 n=1 Tax=Smittium mucronatum TaxID=133383 RepID=A0A1R0GXA5_9FUNG|nr:hypothetical protein AYI68_g4371 [Smittium mucronatum]
MLEFSLIHFAVVEKIWRRSFMLVLYDLVLEHLDLSSADFVNIGAIYSLYMLYRTQPSVFPLVPIKVVTTGSWSVLKEFYLNCCKREYSDCIYIIDYLITHQVFEFAAVYNVPENVINPDRDHMYKQLYISKLSTLEMQANSLNLFHLNDPVYQKKHSELLDTYNYAKKLISETSLDSSAQDLSKTKEVSENHMKNSDSFEASNSAKLVENEDTISLNDIYENLNNVVSSRFSNLMYVDYQVSTSIDLSDQTQKNFEVCLAESASNSISDKDINFEKNDGFTEQIITELNTSNGNEDVFLGEMQKTTLVEGSTDSLHSHGVPDSEKPSTRSLRLPERLFSNVVDLHDNSLERHSDAPISLPSRLEIDNKWNSSDRSYIPDHLKALMRRSQNITKKKFLASSNTQ